MSRVPGHSGATAAPKASGAPKGMAWVPGGSFLMGSAAFYPEERPVRAVGVAGFWMDVHPVTVAEFRRFVRATGYTTVAERPLDPARYPGADPALLVPGALVFSQPPGPVPLDDYRRWWRYQPGADWRRPGGPDAAVPPGWDRHPVTQVAHEDALAYAAWAGRALPTEAEWEYAARGGLDGAAYTWGDEFQPRGRRMANVWYGEFPWRPNTPSGRAGTTPIGRYPANGYGLHDMAGNVWEWTADRWTARAAGGTGSAGDAGASCCAPGRGVGAGGGSGQRTVKGGSHLCAASYCFRYRPAARQGESEDTATSHLGFRCVLRPEASAATAVGAGVALPLLA